MTAPALYDYSPLALLLLGGAALAVLPLAWIWFRHRGTAALRRLQALTLLTLFLTFDLLLFGAFTRLTDSGLGCPDWPGCYGSASPLGAHPAIAAAQSALPSGPVTHGKAWVEMLHRYLASAVGALVLLLAAWAWWNRRKRPSNSANPWWASLTLLWVCLQGAFGAWTVTMRLFPAIVSLHLLGALVLLALLCLQAAHFSQQAGGAAPVDVTPRLRAILQLSLAVVLLQAALGAWVSSNYAVLACTDFPTCQGRWWPLMDFQHGFELWRPLGLTGSGEPIDFAALTAIHYVHRVMAALVLALLAVLALQLNRVVALRVQSRWVAALTGLQVATGLGNVLFDWPLLVAVLHTGGAGALVVILTWALAASRVERRVSAAPATHTAAASRVSA